MKTIILSDIHANEPALKAVLADAGHFDRLVFLGDLANFGPHPAQCVDILCRLAPLCVIGNHDEQIVSPSPKNFWDNWSRQQLSSDQLDAMRHFYPSYVLDGHILLIHGAYGVDYDLLPNTPDEDIEAAFRPHLTANIDQVWFGHYHYHIQRTINGVTYRCMRPVGHHRDGDTRASYYVYENGTVTHRQVAYDLAKTVEDFKNLTIFPEGERKQQFVHLLEHAYEEHLLKKDVEQMRKNEQRRL